MRKRPVPLVKYDAHQAWQPRCSRRRSMPSGARRASAAARATVACLVDVLALGSRRAIGGGGGSGGGGGGGGSLERRIARELMA